VKPSAAEAIQAVLEKYHSGPEVMPMAPVVEGGQTVAGAVYAAASSVDAAGDAAGDAVVEGGILLVGETCPRPHHHRHLRRFCLGSLPGPCARVVVHTREHQPCTCHYHIKVSSHIDIGRWSH